MFGGYYGDNYVDPTAMMAAADPLGSMPLMAHAVPSVDYMAAGYPMAWPQHDAAAMVVMPSAQPVDVALGYVDARSAELFAPHDHGHFSSYGHAVDHSAAFYSSHGHADDHSAALYGHSDDHSAAFYGHTDDHTAGHFDHFSSHSDAEHFSSHSNDHSSGHFSSHNNGHSGGHFSSHSNGHSSGHFSSHSNGHSSGHFSSHGHSSTSSASHSVHSAALHGHSSSSLSSCSTCRAPLQIDSCSVGDYRAGFVCDGCGRSYNPAGQRWRCSAGCRHDVCFSCRPAGYAASTVAGLTAELVTAHTPSGRRKALLVGINYASHSSGRLSGCVNDALNMQQFLQSYGFQECCVLIDEGGHPSQQPTRANIMAGIHWLVAGAAAGDSLFFHYSGHGGQVADQSGDEDDGFDETIIPLDSSSAGEILDDELHAHMCMMIPAGCRLTAVMDCCHSGTGLDLPYEYHPTGIAPSAGHSSKKQKKQQKKQRKKQQAAGFYYECAPGTTHGDCMLFSGCRDDQTSADAHIGGQATGAMTWAFHRVLNSHPSLTYLQLLDSMRSVLQAPPRCFDQVPQLTTGRPLNLNVPFTL